MPSAIGASAKPVGLWVALLGGRGGDRVALFCLARLAGRAGKIPAHCLGGAAGECDGPPDARAVERCHLRVGESFLQQSGNQIGEARVLQQHGAIEDELDPLVGFGEAFGAGGGVGGQAVGGLVENGDCDLVLARDRGMENWDGDAGEVGLGRDHRPVDQVLGFVHLQVGEDVCAEGGPVVLEVGDRHHRAQRVLRDVAGAAAIAEDVAAATELCRLAVAVAPGDARASAAEDEDLCGAVAAPRAGLERGCQVIGGRAGDTGPHFGDRCPQPRMIRIEADAREADTDPIRRRWQAIADTAQVGLQVAWHHQAQVGGSGLERGEHPVLGVREQDRRPRAAALDAKADWMERIGIGIGIDFRERWLTRLAKLCRGGRNCKDRQAM